MLRNILKAALVSAATVIAGPAIAGPGGGHGGAGGMVGPSTHMSTGSMAGSTHATTTNSRVNSQASMHASQHATMHSGTRSAVRVGSTSRTHAAVHSRHRIGTRANANVSTRAGNSQALMHASIRAIERASPNSVLARGAVRASVLPGLATGLTVKGSGGATVGTVSRVVTGTDGKIRLVLATSASGRTIRLVPNTLSVSGGVVTTTML